MFYNLREIELRLGCNYNITQYYNMRYDINYVNGFYILITQSKLRTRI